MSSLNVERIKEEIQELHNEIMELEGEISDKMTEIDNLQKEIRNSKRMPIKITHKKILNPKNNIIYKKI